MMDVRRNDRRALAGGFFLLGSFLLGHAMLETARDALLLAAMPATTLAWAYVGIAAVALLLARSRAPVTPRRVAVELAVGAVTTAAFLPFLGSPAALLALYIWVGALASVAVPRIWILLARSFSLGQAKRLFALVGAGGIVGAAAGAGLAGVIAGAFGPRALVVFGAGAILVSGLVASAIGRSEAVPAAPAAEGAPTGKPHLVRLVILALLASTTVTLLELLFKSTVQTSMPAGDLAGFFSRFSLATNLGAVVMQLVVAPFVLRRSGAPAALAVLPALVLAGAGGFVALGLVPLLLLAKGADGALRNSLHRVGMEILHLATPAAARERHKGTADALGHRGGQALASLGTLAAAALGGGAFVLALALVALAVGWLVAVALARRSYLGAFRDDLRRGADGRLPALDLLSLEAVVEALSSPDEAEVVGALELLHAHGKGRLLPGLILHHPSPLVVRRALDVLAASRRPDILSVTQPLVAHPDPELRAAVLRVRRDPAELRAALTDPSPAVRAAATVALAPRPGELLGDGDPHVVREAVLAAQAAPHPGHVPALIALLGDRELRGDVRRALIACLDGDPGPLLRALGDAKLPHRVRVHVPRTLVPMPSAHAAAGLLARLAVEPDGRIRFKILRALGRMKAEQPHLSLDERRILGLAEDNLHRAIDVTAWRLEVATRPDGFARDLLLDLLREKERHALERVFRTIGLMRPDGDLEAIWEGVTSGDPRRRDGSLELLGEIAPEPLRTPLLAFLDDVHDDERVRRLAGYHRPGPAALAMLADHSQSIQRLARSLLPDLTDLPQERRHVG